MAMQPDIQYVPFHYVDGSAARKVQRQTFKKASAAPVPKPRRAKCKVIAVDPAAIGGILVAVTLLVMMLVGFSQYSACRERTRQMEDRLTAMQLENSRLEQTYVDDIDLDYIREVADAMGMVPAQNAQQVQIQVQLPQQETPKMNLWESFTTFLAGLFA